jgi:hypothetical protein
MFIGVDLKNGELDCWYVILQETKHLVSPVVWFLPTFPVGFWCDGASVGKQQRVTLSNSWKTDFSELSKVARSVFGKIEVSGNYTV